MPISDLNTLVLFAKVVEANSFSEAARRLKMPLSTVSRRVAELEEQLGVRLLERSTRSLRLTDAGAELLEHAQRSVELGEAVDNIASQHQSRISGLLRLSTPPSISDTLISPIVCAFQRRHPDVRVQILITERVVDHIAEGVDLAFRIGPLADSSLVARRLLRYRHRLVASPKYLKSVKAPRTPLELAEHRLLTFAMWQPEQRWEFVHGRSGKREALLLQPYLSMNDYAGLAHALLEGVGIGELPPLVRPELLQEERLVEVLPAWHFQELDVAVVHLGSRLVSRPVRAFKEFAVEMAKELFPEHALGVK
jgi:DNA-binding transcriptional LysR family regulator